MKVNRSSGAAAMYSHRYRNAVSGVVQTPGNESKKTTSPDLKERDLMSTSVLSYFKLARENRAKKVPNIDRPMSIIGRQNVEHAKWAIDTLARTLVHAFKQYDIPGTVSHFLNARNPFDLAIRPLPGAMFRPIGINSVYWTNTKHRSNALFWSREFNGSRAWHAARPDKVQDLGRWVDLQDPYGRSKAWVAVTTRAASVDGCLCCHWVPQRGIMQYHAMQPSLPLSYLASCEATAYDATTKRFDISPEMIAKILGVKGWAA